MRLAVVHPPTVARTASELSNQCRALAAVSIVESFQVRADDFADWWWEQGATFDLVVWVGSGEALPVIDPQLIAVPIDAALALALVRGRLGTSLPLGDVDDLCLGWNTHGWGCP